jgi:hypothetical protein
MKMMWIDSGDIEEGATGFLIEKSDANNNRKWHLFGDYPPHTNQSNRPRPVGWCGSYNNVTTSGLGIWQVVKALPNGRCKLLKLTDLDAITAYLEEVGYPDIDLSECV